MQRTQRFLLALTAFLVFMNLLAACGNDSSSIYYAPDIVERAAKYPSADLSQSPLYDSLQDWEKAVVAKLIEASAYMDAAYWQQVDPVGEQLWKNLASATTATEQAAYTMLDAHYGRWDRFNNFETVIGTQQRPPGGYVYPADLTKSELDAYIAANPTEKDALLSPYTVIRRNGSKLVAVPYHTEYAQYVVPVARLLNEAAALSQNQSLTTYLKLQAQALLTDDYFNADIAWIDLNATIDLSIGPQETYDDQLTGQKAFYKINVLLVDQSAAVQLAKYKSTGPALQANLPVDDKYKPPYKADTMMPLLLADDIRRSGQSRAVMESVAFSLPNDPRVWDVKGSKKVMMGNYLKTRSSVVLQPLARIILAPEVVTLFNYDAYFTWVLMHEIGHTLGPREVTVNGTTITPREALGEYYSPIEEGKADISALYNIPYLISQGIVTQPLEWHYVGFLMESLRSIRFGMGSAYGVIRSAAWNIIVDEGGLVYDSASNRFIMNVAKMTDAVRNLLITIITLEGEGDKQGAAAFITKYANVRPELQKLLNTAETTVPLEFVPVYAP